MLDKIKKEYLLLVSSFLAVVLAVVLSLFNHWEMGGDTWCYWFFARVFRETGKFIILDRSSLYTLYLNLFYWLGYPTSVTIEYLVTTTIAVFALVLFLKKYVGLGWATFAAILWIPFLQTAEPPTQKLALACSIFAVIIRQTGESRFKFMTSYAFLFLAYLFRLSYIALIPLFAAYDLIKLIKGRKWPFWRPRLASDWPMIIMIGLLVWFSVLQSPHPWNNSWLATTKWFPYDGKNLARASFIQSSNTFYIANKYKSFVNKDFYFTNKELGGQSDLLGNIMHAPKLFAVQVLRNTQSLFYTSLGITGFAYLYPKPPHSPYLLQVSYWVGAALLFLIIVSGAFFAVAKDKLVLLFIAGNLFLVLSNILSIVQQQYSISLIPILLLSACWYALQINGKKSYFSMGIILAVFLALFSNGTTNWARISGNLFNDLKNNDIRVLERRPYSMKASYDELNLLSKNKRGVLSLEHAFIGAFVNIPLKNIYDVWEIPPFGRLGKSAYKGLARNRIDCVFVSHHLSTEIGYGTNYQIRYQNYIKPYVNRLMSDGARSLALPYGDAYFIQNIPLKRSGRL